MCEADAGRNTSLGVIPNPAIALATIQPNVSCECVTPFGLPVLPDVKKIIRAPRAAAAAVRIAGRIRCQQFFQLGLAGRRSRQT